MPKDEERLAEKQLFLILEKFTQTYPDIFTFVPRSDLQKGQPNPIVSQESNVFYVIVEKYAFQNTIFSMNNFFEYYYECFLFLRDRCPLMSIR